MLSKEYENKVINSEKLSILEISPGWYLASNDLQLPGFIYEGYDFTKTKLEITSKLEEAMYFELNCKKDRNFQFAKDISDQFDTSSFKNISIQITPQTFK